MVRISQCSFSKNVVNLNFLLEKIKAESIEFLQNVMLNESAQIYEVRYPRFFIFLIEQCLKDQQNQRLLILSFFNENQEMKELSI